MLRATVFENGSSTNGKVLPISATFSEFIASIRAAFDNTQLSVVYTSKGGRIYNVDVIRWVSTMSICAYIYRWMWIMKLFVLIHNIPLQMCVQRWWDPIRIEGRGSISTRHFSQFWIFRKPNFFRMGAPERRGPSFPSVKNNLAEPWTRFIFFENVWPWLPNPAELFRPQWSILDRSGSQIFFAIDQLLENG